ANLADECRDDLVQIDGRPVPVRVTGRSADAATTMGLVVAPCKGPITLAAGEHRLTTARGKDAGFSIDRLVFASGTDARRGGVRDGRVLSLPASPNPSPTVTVTENGRTKLRAHVTGATKPFWLVLGQSHSPGWHARIAGGNDLGDAQLVDGYANGWLVSSGND